MRRVSLMASSAPGEYRPALFEKGPNTFREILGRRTGGKALGLAPQLRVEGIAEGRLEQRLGPAISVRRSRGEPLRHRRGFGREGLRRENAIDKTQFQRAPRIETIA